MRSPPIWDAPCTYLLSTGSVSAEMSKLEDVRYQGWAHCCTFNGRDLMRTTITMQAGCFWVCHVACKPRSVSTFCMKHWDKRLSQAHYKERCLKEHKFQGLSCRSCFIMQLHEPSIFWHQHTVLIGRIGNCRWTDKHSFRRPQLRERCAGGFRQNMPKPFLIWVHQGGMIC